MELRIGAVVKISEADGHAQLHGGPLLLVAVEVATTAEEAREEVEGVLATTASASALFVALDAFVAVLVVDATELRVAEGFVGFGDLDEFVLGGAVVGVLVRVVLFA